MVRDCLALSVDGRGAAITFKDVYFGRCEGRLALDGMYLRKFLSNFCKN